MSNLLLLPLKLLGLTAAGLALGVGWKLGSHLVDVAMGEKTLSCFPTREQPPKPGETPVTEPTDPQTAPLS